MAVILGTKPYTKVARTKEFANLAYGDTIYLTGTPAPGPTPGVGTLYLVERRTDALYSVDVTTGIATRVAPGVNRFNANVGGPTATDYGNGKVYMADQSREALFTLDVAAGTAARVGSANRFGIGERNPEGMGYDDDNDIMYMTSSSGGGRTAALHSLNLTTGVATRIASTTIDSASVTVHTMTYANSKMYVAGFGGSGSGFFVFFGTINLSNGVITTITRTMGSGSITWDGAKMYSIVVGSRTGTAQLGEIDISDGSSTRIGTSDNFGITNPNVESIVFVPSAAPDPDPDPEPEPGFTTSFTFTPDQTNASVAGFFTNINHSFTHGGRTYTITRCFTHNNGIQIRFDDNADALAFIAGGFTVNSGIAGQQPFASSVMDNINSGGQKAAQYRAFPGRYQGGTSYTVTITA